MDSKEYMKEYRSIHKERIKKQGKEYHFRPEVKVHLKKYFKEYNSRPEVKERGNKYPEANKNYIKERKKKYRSK